MGHGCLFSHNKWCRGRHELRVGAVDRDDLLVAKGNVRSSGARILEVVAGEASMVQWHGILGREIDDADRDGSEI